jgi:hypothetical protein
MAITILARMYDNVINNTEDAVKNFAQTIKIVSAYYFIWRSAYPNSGLDSTYRDFFKENTLNNESISIEKIKRHFKSVLTDKEINTLENWKIKAKNYLKYEVTGKEIIRLALLASAHDTIPDNEKGLIKMGRSDSSNYLCLKKWLSKDLKTIEHIAPQTNKNNLWDENLYDTQTKSFQAIGNLTLLPQELNSSAGNKGWKEKLLYYKSVAERDPSKIAELESIANNSDIELNPNTISILQNSQFNQHVESVSILSENDSWNKELIEKRTDRIMDIVWNRISNWIFI